MDPEIPDKMYFKIGEVSQIVGVEAYVLRYWESEFKVIKPYRDTSKQRLYTRKDLETILYIKKLLYEEKYTIAGAKKTLKAPRNQQLSLNLPKKDQRSLLQEIKQDLINLKESLEQLP
ncbi:MAG: MerR family transcriptional regulator [Deltaproteobacteria bacterium]|nr:MerR family transcriptional regulator [Deltaproteobacteria bacterium]